MPEPATTSRPHSSVLDGVEPSSFAEALEDGSVGGKGGSKPRLGPAIAAGFFALLVSAVAVLVPTMTASRSSQGGALPSAAAASGPAAQPGAGAGQSYLGGLGAPEGGSLPLTYANTRTVGLAAQCCSTFQGAWLTRSEGGFPDYEAPLAVSEDPTAWFEWSLEQPAGGRRWDQVKIRVWLPRSEAGAWVRYSVTTTREGAAATTVSFDVGQQEYSGWYELPATFAVGTPDRRTGSAWVRVTYLRPYDGPAADEACRADGCRRMAAGQVQFLWS